MIVAGKSIQNFIKYMKIDLMDNDYDQISQRERLMKEGGILHILIFKILIKY